MNEDRGIRSEILRKHQCLEEHTRSPAFKRVELNEDGEGCGLVRVGGKNPKNVRWKDMVNAVVERKEATCKEVLGAKDEAAKERYYYYYYY